MRGFIAQLVEHRTRIAEVTGSNPVEALIFFQASSFQLLKLENLLRWSLFTFIYNRSTIKLENLLRWSLFTFSVPVCQHEWNLEMKLCVVMQALLTFQKNLSSRFLDFWKSIRNKIIPENYNWSGFKKSLILEIVKKENQQNCSWFQSISSRHIFVLFEAKSSKQGSTVQPFTIMMQKV